MSSYLDYDATKKPYRDAWNHDEIEKIKIWGSELSKILLEQINYSPQIYTKKYWSSNPLVKFYKKYLPICKKSNCKKCGKCVAYCPYNALSMSEDIEDGFPVVDSSKCRGCSRCFNICPFNAIHDPFWSSERRSQSPKPNFVTYGEKDDDGMISQPYPLQPTSIFKRGSLGFEKYIILFFVVLVLFISVLIKFIKN